MKRKNSDDKNLSRRTFLKKTVYLSGSVVLAGQIGQITSAQAYWAGDMVKWHSREKPH